MSKKDLNEIHYYFGKHRPKNKMISHLKLQAVLGISLGIIMILFHFFERVLPGVNEPISNLDPKRTIPYIVALSAIYYLLNLKKKNAAKYEEFLENSPGKEINTKKVEYGPGHGHESG